MNTEFDTLNEWYGNDCIAYRRQPEKNKNDGGTVHHITTTSQADVEHYYSQSYSQKTLLEQLDSASTKRTFRQSNHNNNISYDVLEEEESKNSGNHNHLTQRSPYDDSPYYSDFVQNEIASIKLAASTLEDINQQASMFAAVGSEMSKAMRSLSLSCQFRGNDNNDSSSSSQHHGENQQNTTIDNDHDHADDAMLRKRKEIAIGSKIASTLKRLGKVLEDMATEQENMCNAVKSALGSHLGEICDSQLMVADELKDQADSETQRTEDLLASLLRSAGDNKTVIKSSVQDYIKKDVIVMGELSENDYNDKQLQQPRWSLLSCHSSRHSSKSPRSPFTNQIDTGTDHTLRYDVSLDSSDGKNSISKTNDDTIRQVASIQQVRAELKRFHLYKFLVAAKNQRDLELSRGIGQFFTSMRGYSILCKEMLSGELQKDILHNQEMYEKLRFDTSAMNNKQQLQEIEKSLMRTLNTVTHAIVQRQIEDDGKEEFASSYENNCTIIHPKNNKNYSFWEIPAMLSICSSPCSSEYSSTSVIVEGWLYEKYQQQCQGYYGFSRLTTNTNCKWIRRWYVMKLGKLYYMEEQQEQRNLNVDDKKNTETILKKKKNDSIICQNRTTRKRGNVPTTPNTSTDPAAAPSDLLEVCEISICSIKSLRPGDRIIAAGGGNPTDNYTEYCFEIIFPAKCDKSIILQARGPKELNLWLDGFRRAANHPEAYVSITF